MRVFVLGTGRCGTTTFVRACGHLSNYTAGHETRVRCVGAERFDYPDRHIEADNRLTWFLGQLGRQFPDALYIHLRRRRDEVVDSFLHRWDTGSIIDAFAHQIVMHRREWPVEQRRDVCRFYVDAVTANVEQFLAGRRSMTMWLHEARESFPAFLDHIGAEGDRAAALNEWTVRHNATPEAVPMSVPPSPRPGSADRVTAAAQPPLSGRDGRHTVPASTPARPAAAPCGRGPQVPPPVTRVEQSLEVHMWGAALTRRVLTGLRSLPARQKVALAAAGALAIVAVAGATGRAGGTDVGTAATALSVLMVFSGLVLLRRRLAQLHRAVGVASEEVRANQRRILAGMEGERKVAAARQRELLAGLDRSRRKAREEVARCLADNGQQTEALLQLFRDLVPRAPMPSSGRWALNPTGLLHLLHLIERRKPSLILELGSGTSTVWISYALERTGGRLVSLDHEREYAARTRALLAEHGLHGVVEVREAPLRPMEIDGAAFRWYDLGAVADLDDIDLLLVDGPPGRTGPQARYPALHLLAHKLAASATVVLDDADRADERATLHRWTATISGLTREPALVGTHAVLSYARPRGPG